MALVFKGIAESACSEQRGIRYYNEKHFGRPAARPVPGRWHSAVHAAI